MKKSIAIFLSLIIALSAVMAACSSRTDDKETTAEGLEAAGNEYGFETVDVTDEDGKTVTDKNGNTVTTEVNVEYVTDKKGNTVAKLIDTNGEHVTNKKGKDVTVKTDVELTSSTTDAENIDPPTKKETSSSKSTTAPTKKNEATTNSELTTISTSKDKIPSTSATGTAVTFSSNDQQIIKNMLEVPYLYEASYENADGVPVKIAAHAAIWMAEREGLNTASFASGTIVLDLFKYYGQTVVNFKTKCNEESGNENISYNAKNDTFTISNFENETHKVSIEKIEDLGNNNYYKVTASVSGAKGIKKVIAIVQKNKLDSTLGFSIKALKWS